MDQLKLIDTLYSWIKTEYSSVICLCDHVGDERTSLGLYINSKLPGKARGQQISQADIVVHNDKNVLLVVEVDPVLNPKKIIGSLLSAAIADYYCPSFKTNTDHISLVDATILYVTVVEDSPRSQKKQQLDNLNNALSGFISRNCSGISSAQICYGSNEDEAIEEAKREISTKLSCALTRLD